MSHRKSVAAVLPVSSQMLIEQLIAGYQIPACWDRYKIDPQPRKVFTQWLLFKC